MSWSFWFAIDAFLYRSHVYMIRPETRHAPKALEKLPIHAKMITMKLTAMTRKSDDAILEYFTAKGDMSAEIPRMRPITRRKPMTGMKTITRPMRKTISL